MSSKRPQSISNGAKQQKRAKTSRAALGETAPAAVTKAEDELALEEAVFGTSRGGKGSVWDAEVVPGAFVEDKDAFVETGLERLEDDNLFFVDVPEASTSAFPASGSDEDEPLALAPIGSSSKPKIKSRNGRQPAWVDPSDSDLTVALADTTRLRKLRDTQEENVVTGIEYETKLRRQFEKMHPPPSWATDARKKIASQRKRSAATAGRAIGAIIDSEGSDVENSADEDEVENLFRATTGITRKARLRGGVLDKGEINIVRDRNANECLKPTERAGIVEIGFHPREQVLFSATSDRRLRLFHIDGTTNELWTTIHVPELPMTNASFEPSGSSILMTGNRPFFMSYDLQSGTVHRSPRGLLTADLSGSNTGGLNHPTFSPEGDKLAVAGRGGHVHLVDWGTGGAATGQVIGDVKVNGQIFGMAWAKGGRELLTLGEGSEVNVWDVGERRCVSRWKDDGGFEGCAISTSSGGFTAIGSGSGIVNIYDPSSAVPSQGEERKALKAVGNLTTKISTMRFNHDSQILAIASNKKKDALKLVHLPSATVFANWPTQQTPINVVASVDFSRRSEWFAVGTKRGDISLWNLNAYSSGKKN